MQTQSFALATSDPLAYNSSRRPVASLAAEKEPVRILIADGQTISRDGLRALLGRVEDFTVVGEAADGETAISLVQQLNPDVLLLDPALPQERDVLTQLSAADFRVRVLVFSSDIGSKETVRAINLGVRGVVLKNSPSLMLFDGIRRVMAGEYWFSPDSVVSLVVELRRRVTRAAPAPVTQFGLTRREQEIIVEVVAGLSNQEIADRLFVSKQTVKHHLTHIFDKLGVYSRVELALFAVHHKLAE